MPTLPSQLHTIQEGLNVLNNSSNLTEQQCLNKLAGTTQDYGMTREAAWNIYAGTSGLSIQQAANVKNGTVNWTVQECVENLAYGFSASTISGLKLWVKADTGLFQDSILTTPATANNAPVGGWVDQSGSGNNILQATANSRPLLKTNTLNSKSTVLFDGTDDNLKAVAFTLGTPVTIYLVFNLVAFVNSRYIFDGDTGDTMGLYENSDPNLTMYAGAGLTNTGFVVGTFAIGTFIFNEVSSISQKNNVTEVTGNVGGNVPAGFNLGLGAGGYGNIQVAEVLLYNTAHTGAQRTQVKNYLATKWAITI